MLIPNLDGLPPRWAMAKPSHIRLVFGATTSYPVRMASAQAGVEAEAGEGGRIAYGNQTSKKI